MNLRVLQNRGCVSQPQRARLYGANFAESPAFANAHYVAWRGVAYEVPVTYEGITYGSSEAAFQAAKSLNPADRERISKLSPDESKRAGYSVKLREAWETVKVSVMEKVLQAKFTQNPDLMEKLSATGQALLVEGNTWRDTFWGFDVNLGYGVNMLGHILMRLRAEHQGKL